MLGYNFQKDIVFFCLKIIFTFTNSVGPDEMQHYAAFHLGLHCLQKYHEMLLGSYLLILSSPSFLREQSHLVLYCLEYTVG